MPILKSRHSKNAKITIFLKIYKLKIDPNKDKKIRIFINPILRVKILTE